MADETKKPTVQSVIEAWLKNNDNSKGTRQISLNSLPFKNLVALVSAEPESDKILQPLTKLLHSEMQALLPAQLLLTPITEKEGKKDYSGLDNSIVGKVLTKAIDDVIKHVKDADPAVPNEETNTQKAAKVKAELVEQFHGYADKVQAKIVEENGKGDKGAFHAIKEDKAGLQSYVQGKVVELDASFKEPEKRETLARTKKFQWKSGIAGVLFGGAGVTGLFGSEGLFGKVVGAVSAAIGVGLEYLAFSKSAQDKVHARVQDAEDAKGTERSFDKKLVDLAARTLKMLLSEDKAAATR